MAQLSALLRFVILARLLGPEQLGLAATLILCAQFMDFVTDGGMDRFLIQHRQGNLRRVQALVHLVSIVRGIAIATALILLAGPLADFFQAPQLKGAFVWLALTPLIAGLAHYDYRRRQRARDFRPEAAVLMAGELVSVVATSVAAWATRDFTAVLYGLAARSAAVVIASHLTAERAYRVRFDRKFLGPLSSFGWPLMLNGVVLFVGGQGDRLVVGSQLGLAALGHYSAIMLLIYYPSTTLARFIQTVNLPVLASSRDEPARLRASMRAVGGLVTLLSVSMAIGFALLAPVFVPILFGSAFAQTPLVIALIGIVQVTRFARAWPTVVALANGRSDIVLVNNVIRVTVFPVAVVVANVFGGIVAVALTFAVGELLALAVAIVLTNRALGVPALANFASLLLIVGVFVGVAIAAWAVTAGWLAIAIAAACAGLLVLTVVLVRERSTIAIGFTAVVRLVRPPRARPSRI